MNVAENKFYTAVESWATILLKISFIESGMFVCKICIKLVA